MLSTFLPIASRRNWININYGTYWQWIDVFWASFQNLTLIICFRFLLLNIKISNTDRRFLIFASLSAGAQCLLYSICPLVSQNTIDVGFIGFCILILCGLGVLGGD